LIRHEESHLKGLNEAATQRLDRIYFLKHPVEYFLFLISLRLFGVEREGGVLDYGEFEGEEVSRKEFIVGSNLKFQKDGGVISEREEIVEIEIEGLKRRINELERRIKDLQKEMENLEKEMRKLEEEREKKESEKEKWLNKWFVRKRAERVEKIEKDLEKIEKEKKQKEELKKKKLEDKKELEREKLESEEKLKRKEELLSFYRELEKEKEELNERIKGGLSISRKKLKEWKGRIEKIKENLQVEEAGREIICYIDEYIKMIKIIGIKRPSLFFLLTEVENSISKGKYEEKRTKEILEYLEGYRKELEGLVFLKEERILKIFLEKIEEARNNLKKLAEGKKEKEEEVKKREEVKPSVKAKIRFLLAPQDKEEMKLEGEVKGNWYKINGSGEPIRAISLPSFLSNLIMSKEQIQGKYEKHSREWPRGFFNSREDFEERIKEVIKFAQLIYSYEDKYTGLKIWGVYLRNRERVYMNEVVYLIKINSGFSVTSFYRPAEGIKYFKKFFQKLKGDYLIAVRDLDINEEVVILDKERLEDVAYFNRIFQMLELADDKEKDFFINWAKEKEVTKGFKEKVIKASREGRYDLSLRYNEILTNLLEVLKDKESLLENCIVTMNLAKKMGELEKAIGYGEKVVRLSEELKEANLPEYCRRLAELYEEAGNYQKAAFYAEKAGNLWESEGKKEKAVRVLGKASKYYYELNEYKKAAQVVEIVGQMNLELGEMKQALRSFKLAAIDWEKAGDFEQLSRVQEKIREIEKTEEKDGGRVIVKQKLQDLTREIISRDGGEEDQITKIERFPFHKGMLLTRNDFLVLFALAEKGNLSFDELKGLLKGKLAGWQIKDALEKIWKNTDFLIQQRDIFSLKKPVRKVLKNYLEDTSWEVNKLLVNL
ncbi:MAG: hypothetical protein DRP76_04850, partial [Candidatus Omnitrophota bacterium]